ncbi:MAG: hypothetical protein PHE78_04025 [Candidatus Gastranaerophilales bacterium]|nr:hypothetical protein [Candidatus Gastranaerophilales bacterium]
MTVNFGSIKNTSTGVMRWEDAAGNAWNTVKVCMHFDNNGSKDLDMVKKSIPDFKESDTLHIQSSRPVNDPIDGATIDINGAPFINGYVNDSFFKPFVQILKNLVNSDDKAIKPSKDFVDSGKLKFDIFGPASDQIKLDNQALEREFANPKDVKFNAQEILTDIKINEQITLGQEFRNMMSDIHPELKKQKDLLN